MYQRTPSKLTYSGYSGVLLAGAVFVCVSFLALKSTSASAAQFFPENTAQLLAAFEKASRNLQDDVIDLAGGSFSLTTELNLEHDEGHGLELMDGVLIRANKAEAFRLLNLHKVSHMFENDKTIKISSVEFRNGLKETNDPLDNDAGGGAILSHRDLLIKDSLFENNRVVGYTFGGAIRHSRNLDLHNVQFFYNSALPNDEFQTTNGGAISIDDGGSLFATQTYFLRNFADEGGAIYAAQGVNSLIITRSSFDGNTASELGGGIWSSVGEGGVRISNSSFITNHAPKGGAAIYTQSLFVDVSFAHLTLWGNISDEGTGGGIRAMLPRDGSNVLLKNSIFVNNIGGNCTSTEGDSLSFHLSNHNLLDDSSCGEDGNTQLDGSATVFNGKYDYYGGLTPSLPISKQGQARNFVPREYCLEYDGRDVKRLDNADELDDFCDAGAFEIVPVQYIDADGDNIRNNTDNCVKLSNPLQSRY